MARDRATDPRARLLAAARPLFAWWHRRRRAVAWGLFAVVLVWVAGVLWQPDAWEGERPGAGGLALAAMNMFLGQEPAGIRTPHAEAYSWAAMAALLFTATAVLEAAFHVLSRLWWRIVLRPLHRGHVVVCGLGQSGAHIARTHADAGWPVVAIERNASCPEIEELRGLGIRVHVADATTPAALEDAAAFRAARVFAVADDASNIEVAHQVEHAPGATALVLPHVTDRHLYEQLVLNESATRRSAGAPRVRHFNAGTLAGAGLVDWMPEEWPGAPPLFAPTGGRNLYVVVGVGATGQEFVVRATRRWIIEHARREGSRAPEFVLIAPPSRNPVAELEADHPELAHAWRLHRVPMALPDPEFTRGTFLGACGGDAPRRFLVTLPSDAASVTAGLELLRIAVGKGWRETLIAVRHGREHGVVWCETLMGNSTDSTRILQPYNRLEQSLGTDFLRHMNTELIAIALHKAYRAELRQQEAKSGRAFTREEKPADVEWEVLAEQYRESTRQQAASIELSLAALDVPRVVEPGDGPGDTLSEKELEELSRREHDRWMGERRAAGWTLGPKNPEAKTHPDMVPFDDLSEQSKDYDRAMVRKWPAALASAGLVIRRKR